MRGTVDHLTPIHQNTHSGMYHAKEYAYFEIPITIYNAHWAKIAEKGL